MSQKPSLVQSAQSVPEALTPDSDEAYIRDLASAIAQFNEELEALVERVRSYEATPTLREALQQSVAGEAA